MRSPFPRGLSRSFGAVVCDEPDGGAVFLGLAFSCDQLYASCERGDNRGKRLIQIPAYRYLPRVRLKGKMMRK